MPDKPYLARLMGIGFNEPPRYEQCITNSCELEFQNVKKAVNVVEAESSRVLIRKKLLRK